MVLNCFLRNVNDWLSTDNVTCIGNYAFYECSSLTSIVIPDSVTSIGEKSFYGCSSLDTVTFAEGSKLTNIGSNAFCNCSSLTSIVIPNSVTSIGEKAFYGCLSLTSITIPASVTSIGITAFYGCSGLDTVIFAEGSRLTSIESGAFAYCSSLTSITIPASVTSIGGGAFYICSNLTIFCRAEEKPAGWDNDWNPDNRPVIWGCKTVNLFVNNGAFGSVTGAGIYPVDYSIVSISAIPSTGYHFTQWSDGVADNPRSVTVVSDTSFTALFAINSYNVTASAENGSVEGTGSCNHGGSATLTAFANAGYHFSRWSNGTSENPYTLVVVSDTSMKALFEKHDTIIDAAVAATCTTAGKTEGKHCSVCDSVFVGQKEIAAFGHDTIIDAAIAATCTTAGKTEGKHCSVCDSVFVEQKEIAAFGHDTIIDAAVAATCTSAGLTEGSHCSVCDSVFVGQKEIAAFGHDTVIDAAVAATCTSAGLTEGSHCSVCDSVFVAQTTVPMLDHSFTNYVYNNDATTEKDGTETAECDHGCGEKHTRTAEGTKLETDIASDVANAVSISAHHNVIVVENADADIYVYDVTGRLVARRDAACNISIAMPREGMYIVKVGETVKRIVIR